MVIKKILFMMSFVAGSVYAMEYPPLSVKKSFGAGSFDSVGDDRATPLSRLSNSTGSISPKCTDDAVVAFVGKKEMTKLQKNQFIIHGLQTLIDCNDYRSVQRVLGSLTEEKHRGLLSTTLDGQNILQYAVGKSSSKNNLADSSSPVSQIVSSLLVARERVDSDVYGNHRAPVKHWRETIYLPAWSKAIAEMPSVEEPQAYSFCLADDDDRFMA